MSRTKGVAALSGLVAMIAAAFVALPAQAAPASGNANIDFEGGSFAPWQANGATVTIVPEPGNESNHVGSVTGRGADSWKGIGTANGVYEAGVEYTFSARVKSPVATSAHFTTYQPSQPSGSQYSWVGDKSVPADTWTTVTGTFTFAGDTSGAKASIEVMAATDYLVDDIVVTGESLAPEPCTPTTVTDSSLNFESGAELGAWQKSGGPTLGQVVDPADPGNHVLEVANRQFSYDGIESANLALASGTAYTVSMKVRLAAGAGTQNMRLVKKPGYNWVSSNLAVTDAAWTTLTATITPDATGWTVYLGSDPGEIGEASGGTFTYLVDDVTVTHETACDDGPAPGTVALSTGFEDGFDGWVMRDSGTDPYSFERVTTDAHSGDYSGFVSERVSQGNGPGIDVTDLLSPGVIYDLTAWVKLVNPSSSAITVSLASERAGESTAFGNLIKATGLTGGEWQKVSGQVSVGNADRLFLYFETPWADGAAGDTTDFYVDDISVVVATPPVVEDLTPIKDTVDFPVGVAIDSRETTGSGAELLLKHFDQVTPENYMKPEAWYNASGAWAPSSEIDTLMDFAKDNDLRLYGHVLVWHSQTPAWFFQDASGQPLTTSAADKQFLRDRLRNHINNVAEYLSQWGDYGDGNPLTAFDVVNEVIDDSSKYDDGLRRSEWYRILGEEYIELAFEYADQAFNHGPHTAESADRPVKLFINDYNTEQSGKRGRYLALIDQLLADGVPVDGIGHQFHVSLSMPVSALNDALTDASSRGLLQAVTELDVTTGVPESTAKFIDQGYYYRDAFEVFRAHSDQMFSVTVWGLNDARSWRDSSGGPLIFDDGFQAKQAYYGIVEPSGEEDPLPARLRTANSFQGDVPATAGGVGSAEWTRLPLLPAGDNAGFQTRWAADHLTVYVDVDDATVNAGDAVTVELGDDDYTLNRAGGALGTVVEGSGGYRAVLHVPLTDAEVGDAIQLDVRVTDDDTTTGWNNPGVLGTVTLVEPLSHTDVPEAGVAPVIDGTRDDVWSTSSQVQTIKQISGTNGAIGTFHLLWKDQTLYVYAEVADPTVDVSGSDPWVQDSVEIYLDAANSKNGSYRYDDTQIRINADNVTSFGTGDEAFQAARVQSQTKRVAGGYVVEAAISLLEYGGLGSIQGLDVQVNDATGGARTAIRNWADPTGAGYQSSARWGVATLVEGTLIAQNAFTPKVSGSAVVGTTLKVTGLPAGTTLSYQWLRNGAAIGGATGSTYKVSTSDAGKKLSVRVTSVRAGYTDRTETSAQTAVVLKTFSKVYAPVISGTAKVGYKLTAKVQAWSPSASFKYQWYSNGKAISGATKSTFKPTRAQAGTTLTVKVTGSKSGYVTQSKVSKGKKVSLLTMRVDRSKLNGPTRVGGVLRVTAGASHPVSTSKTYQWKVNGKAISGATKSTYTVKAKDLGKRITVTVTYRAQGFATKTVVVGPTYRIAAR